MVRGSPSLLGRNVMGRPDAGRETLLPRDRVHNGTPRNATVTRLCRLRPKKPFRVARARLRLTLVAWIIQTDEGLAGRRASDRTISLPGSPKRTNHETAASGGQHAPTEIRSGLSRSLATASRLQT